MPKTVLIAVLTIGFLMIPFLIHAEVYKWIDDKGTIHFTDDYSKIPEKYQSTSESQKTPQEASTPNVKGKPASVLKEQDLRALLEEEIAMAKIMAELHYYNRFGAACSTLKQKIGPWDELKKKIDALPQNDWKVFLKKNPSLADELLRYMDQFNENMPDIIQRLRSGAAAEGDRGTGAGVDTRHLGKAPKQTSPREFTIPGHGVLVLDVPHSWAQDVRQPPKELPPTIVLRPEKGDEFQLLITALWSPTKDKDFNAPQKVKQLVSSDAKAMASSAVEKELVVQEIKRTTGSAFYFLATDKAPKPGEYPYAIRAGIAVDDLLLRATLLSRNKDSEVVKTVLNIFSTARKGETFRIPIPSTSITFR